MNLVCFVEIEVDQPAADRVLARECAEANFAHPIFDLVVEVFVFCLADALQNDLFSSLGRNTIKDER